MTFSLPLDSICGSEIQQTEKEQSVWALFPTPFTNSAVSSDLDVNGGIRPQNQQLIKHGLAGKVEATESYCIIDDIIDNVVFQLAISNVSVNGIFYVCIFQEF